MCVFGLCVCLCLCVCVCVLWPKTGVLAFIEIKLNHYLADIICVFSRMQGLWRRLWLPRSRSWTTREVEWWRPVNVSGTVLRQFSFSVSTASAGVVMFGKTHWCSTPSLSSLPPAALETVTMLIWLGLDLKRLECQHFSFFLPLFISWSVLCSWLALLREYFKPLSISLPYCRPFLLVNLLTTLPVPGPVWKLFSRQGDSVIQKKVQRYFLLFKTCTLNQTGGWIG